jgi:hypothetical protein
VTVLLIALAGLASLLAVVYTFHLLALVARGVGMTLGFVVIRAGWITLWSVAAWLLLRGAGVL